MKPRRKATPERRAQLQAELQREREARDAGYRAQALKIFPHVCASCTREFSGKRMKELTVHHKDHNHNNNPPDGSNWELLCIYCHDHEHEKALGGRSIAAGSSTPDSSPSIASPFDALDSLITRKDPDDAGQAE